MSYASTVPSSAISNQAKEDPKAPKLVTSESAINKLTNKPFSRKWHHIYEKRTKLPVWEHKDTFLRLLDENQTIVLVGETGSGKTTQIPQWCVEYCLKQQQEGDRKLCVACTQPRRVAAMSVATRVAEEMDVPLGEQVGYSVRFEARTSPKTLLKYLTDGMLLREAMNDSRLSQYGVVLLDEVHERTLSTDILMGVLKQLIMKRKDVKMVVMSATLEADKFRAFFNGSPLLKIPGRTYQVQDMFAEISQSDLLTSTLITVFQIHRNTNEDGDILVFCSGQDEIQSLITLCKKVLRQAPESLQNLTPLPLYASLPATHQMRVFERNPTAQTNGIGDGPKNSCSTFKDRRVIFATNVAETSITIPNIKYVIDTGKVKCRTYCPKTGLESLKVTTISKAQAIQRSGRAGRVFAGTCYRLYTSEEYDEMKQHLPPEIQRCNLISVILQMISIGVKDIGSFEFLEKPEEARIKTALSDLLSLKAIKISATPDKVTTNGSDTGRVSNQDKQRAQRPTDNNLLNLNYDLTNLGKKLTVFPLNPAMSRILLAANELNCLEEILTVVSLLYVENLFHIPPNKQSQADKMLEKFRTNEGDTIMLLKVFKAFKKNFLLNKSNLKQWCAEHFINTKNLKLARLVRKQLLDLCRSQGMKSSSCGQDTSLVRKALTYGLFNNVAIMWNGKYRNRTNYDIHIHPSSCLFKAKAECILYVDILETNKCYMRNCTLIEMSWIGSRNSFD